MWPMRKKGVHIRSFQSINQSNFYGANILGDARLSSVTAEPEHDVLLDSPSCYKLSVYDVLCPFKHKISFSAHNLMYESLRLS